MKKLCFVVSSPATAMAFLKGPMQTLSKHYTLHLIVNTKDVQPLLAELPLKGVHVQKIERGINPLKDLSCLISMVRFLRKQQFDALHSVSPKAGLMAMLGGLIANVPLRTHTFTGQVWANKKGVFRFLLKSIDRLIAGCATQVLVDGKSQLRYLKEHGVIGSAAQVLGKGSICGVSLTRFAPSASLREERRKTLKLEENEWAFMFLGRLNKDKGVIDLIKAFAQLDQSKKASSLFLVGHDEEQIKKRFQSISSKIHFIPFEKKPEELLQACDSFCLPSYREGFGLSVIEASALEKPIICSDAYGLADTIVQGETGLRHDVGDVDDLKQQLIYALNHPEKMRKMGQAGRRYVEANFSEKLLLEEWERFYQKQLPYKR
jgi:glycosyltransferase involved in cell wall biosynthesis